MKYGENLKKLMIDGKVLRLSLWLRQENQDMYQKVFKYVPDVKYEEINTDEKLLEVCGFTSDEIKKIIEYLNDFKFNKDRNDFVKEKKKTSVEPEDSSPSSSEPSKSPSEMTLDELKVEFKKDYDVWFKSDEEEDFETWLKNKYPGMFIRKDED